MHVHLPKPLHGWREFIGEVGIIVVGVLIALGAEQLVEGWHWSNEARDFQAAVNTEVAFNLATYKYRTGQSDCVERRIAELEKWSAMQRRGETALLNRDIAYPLRVSPDDAIWNSRSADLSAHIKPEKRQAYSDIYSTFSNLWHLEEAERDTWLKLNGFNHATKLSPDELIQLDELIYRAKTLDLIIGKDANWLNPDSATLGVHPTFGDRASSAPSFNPGFCASILQTMRTGR